MSCVQFTVVFIALIAKPPSFLFILNPLKSLTNTPSYKSLSVSSIIRLSTLFIKD